MQGFQQQIMMDEGGGLPYTTNLLWQFDANNNANLYDATSGGSNPANGGTVARWEAENDTAIKFVNASASEQPTWNTGGLNGKSYVAFDGSNDTLQLQTWDSSYAPTFFTVFLVVSNYSDGDSYPTFFSVGSGSSEGLNMYYINSTNNAEASYGSWTTNEVTETNGSFTDGSSNIYRFRGGINSFLYNNEIKINNDSVFTGSSPVSNEFGTRNRAIFGAMISGSTGELYDADCRLYEVLYYSERVSDANCTLIQDYLNDKYSVY